METYNSLQLREVFHLEFLRWLGAELNSSYYALKGGVNLRFFYNSFRYSEDIDLNVQTIGINALQNKVMHILKSSSFQNNLQPFGITEIIPPDITKAKQTQTTQRFKIHLITPNNEDFFTKIEFSRRNFKNNVQVETVSNVILREYKLAPLLVPHYGIISAILQKLDALYLRKIVQARDVFDIYILISQIKAFDKEKLELNQEKLDKIRDNIFSINFEQFRDTVVAYLLQEHQKMYNSVKSWDEIKLKVISFIEGI